jgi:hypothetical protein
MYTHRAGVTQLARVTAFQAVGCAFESRHPLHHQIVPKGRFFVTLYCTDITIVYSDGCCVDHIRNGPIAQSSLKRGPARRDWLERKEFILCYVYAVCLYPSGEKILRRHDGQRSKEICPTQIWTHT